MSRIQQVDTKYTINTVVLHKLASVNLTESRIDSICVYVVVYESKESLLSLFGGIVQYAPRVCRRECDARTANKSITAYTSVHFAFNGAEHAVGPGRGYLASRVGWSPPRAIALYC